MASLSLMIHSSHITDLHVSCLGLQEQSQILTNALLLEGGLNNERERGGRERMRRRKKRRR